VTYPPLDELQRWMQRIRALQEPMERIPSSTPVTVVSDFTASQSAEPFEARGLYAAEADGVSGTQLFKFQLPATRRPVVVDWMRWYIPLTGDQWHMEVAIGETRWEEPGFEDFIGGFLNIGGVPTVCPPLGEIAPATPIIPGAIKVPLLAGGDDVPRGIALRSYVPIGQYFTIQLRPKLGTTVEILFTCLWREIV
jgi:hypothetical protein